MPLAHGKILDLPKLGEFSKDNTDVDLVTTSAFERLENIEERRKCWSPAFSSLHYVFSISLK